MTAPPSVPGNTAPVLQEFVGVVALTDEEPARLALRVSNDRLVFLLYADVDAMMGALGKQVHVKGTFTEGGFAVDSFNVTDDDEPVFLRMGAMSQRSLPALRSRLW